MPISIIVVILLLIFAVNESKMEWINATEAELSQLYTPYDKCVLLSAMKSRAGTGTLNMSTKCTLSGNNLERRCSTFAHLHNTPALGNQLPQSMTHVLSDMSHNYPYMFRVTDLLKKFNQSNRVLVLIGDSVTRNSIESLMCILQKESDPLTVSIVPRLEKILYNAVHYTISLLEFEINIIYHSIWHPYQRGIGGTTTAFKGDFHRLFYRKYKSDSVGALLVFNIGMHERGFRSMTKNLVEMFNFITDEIIPSTSRNLTFLFRESSIQHYNSKAGVFNHNTAKKWRSGELPSPICKPWTVSDEDDMDWRYKSEQMALPKSKKGMCDVVSFREMSKHFWDVHGASPFFKASYRYSTRKGHVGIMEDCTHYQSNASPLLYRYLWHQILLH